MARFPCKGGQAFFIKDIGHQTHASLFPNLGAVGNDDPGALFPAVLQGVQPEIG